MSQLCAGHESGCEAAVHAMAHVFNHPNNDTQYYPVDAFNSQNRQVALHTVMNLCSTLAVILTNIDLFIGGCHSR